MQPWRSLMIVAGLSAIASHAHAAERRFTVSGFDHIRVEGPYQVAITTGRGSSAIATGGNRALDRLSLEVQGSTLIVKPDRSGWGGWPGDGNDGGASIRITTPQLSSAQLNGSGSLAVDRMKAPRISLIISGSGNLAVNAIETDNLVLTLQGSGRASIAGKAANARIALLGAGDIAAPSLNVADADVTAAGSGNISLASSRSAHINASGSGNVAITGKTACQVNNRGTGQISCGDK